MKLFRTARTARAVRAVRAVRAAIVRLALPTLFCPLVLLFAAPGGAPGPGPGPAPAADDPLLRESWFRQERLRARGLFHRFSRAVERPRTKIRIRDSANRRFTMTMSGRVSFNPLDDNWKPVLPRPGEAPLVYAEAEAIFKLGLKTEALRLWKALIAMSHWVPGARQNVHRAARRSVRMINRLRDNDPDFPQIEFLSDPYLYYNEKTNETIVLSDRIGFRTTLPGLWRFARGPDDARPPGKTTLPKTVVYLRRGNLNVTIGMDRFQSAYRIERIPAYVLLWDQRRSLSFQRKSMLGFRRSIDVYDGPYCKRKTRFGEFKSPHGKNYERLAQALRVRYQRDRACYVLASGVGVRRAVPRDPLVARFYGRRPRPVNVARRYRFLEFYFLRPWSGFFLEVRHAPRTAREAREIMNRVLEKSHFSG